MAWSLSTLAIAAAAAWVSPEARAAAMASAADVAVLPPPPCSRRRMWTAEGGPAGPGVGQMAGPASARCGRIAGSHGSQPQRNQVGICADECPTQLLGTCQLARRQRRGGGLTGEAASLAAASQRQKPQQQGEGSAGLHCGCCRVRQGDERALGGGERWAAGCGAVSSGGSGRYGHCCSIISAARFVMASILRTGRIGRSRTQAASTTRERANVPWLGVWAGATVVLSSDQSRLNESLSRLEA